MVTIFWYIHLFFSQHCFFLPGPPYLGLSRQYLQFPQSSSCLHAEHCPHLRFLFPMKTYFYKLLCIHVFLCLGGRSHGAYSSRVVCLSLCLGGRSHEAYCNRVVCRSVCLSATPFLLRTLEGKLWNLHCRYRTQYYLGCELAKVPCKALF